jgi:hypothetical protein
MYDINNIGDNGPPCFKTILHANISDTLPLDLTHGVTYEYIALSAFNILLIVPWITNLCHSNPLNIFVKRFFKVYKRTMQFVTITLNLSNYAVQYTYTINGGLMRLKSKLELGDVFM